MENQSIAEAIGESLPTTFPACELHVKEVFHHMQTARNILKRKLLSLLILVLAMISTVVKGFKKLAPIHSKNVLAIARPVFAVREFSYERSRSRSSGGGRGRGGSRGGSRAPDPFANLNFQKTIKIDPEFKTPITEANLSSETLKVLQAKGFTEMTPVQSQAFTEIFGGKDVVARSRTGTGKTLAFGLPIIERLIADGIPSAARRGDLPVVLILEPTRELAIQVAQELEVILRPHRMRVEAIYGGSSFGAQHDALRRGVHIIVGTPGRMLDHISRGTVNLGNVKHVVLDEGDTMLEMGFQKDVETILMSVKSPGDKARDMATKSLAAIDEKEVGDFARQEEEWFDHFADEASRSDRVQMLLFSATMPGWICKLTDKMMQDPIFLDAVQEGETRLANTIKHVAISLPAYTNPQGRAQCIGQLLEDIIMVQGQGGQCIVFTNFKDDCDYLVGSDTFSRLRAAALHGDISQNQRTETIRSFKEKRLDVLVATDVAARGLDIAGVDLVVHCALPNDIDSYVHRSGRTGRAGRPGTSVLLYNSHEDVSKMSDYQRKLMFQYTYSSLPTPNEVVESYVASMNNKIEGVSNSVCKYFLPHAQAFLAKARKGELLPQDEVLDVTNEAVAVEGDSAAPVAAAASALAPAPVADQTEELVARLMAALSNRQSFSTR